MKKLVLAVAVISAASSVQAEDYPGEYLDLICTLDGVPNKEVSVPTSNWVRESKVEDIGFESKIEYKVDETQYYQSLNTSSNRGGGQMSFYYTTVNRMTGEFNKSHWSGSLSALLNHQLYGAKLVPAKTVVTGTCVPGEHKTEAMF